MMSDESENDVAYEEKRENDPYYIKYKLLLQECARFQRENEKLVFRLREVNKITKRRYKEVQFFRQRLLNVHGQDWSVIPPEVLSDLSEEEEEKPNLAPLIPKKEIKQEKLDEPVKDKQRLEKLEKPKPEKLEKVKVEKPEKLKPEKAEKPKPDKPKTAPKRPPRRKVPKSERDPNAPKRPSNPFFQFCQEQRQPLMEQICSQLKPGEVEPSKQELTRQLAIKWNSLSTNDKKVYVDRYERSKEKYNAQMEDYKRTKE